MFPRTSRKSFLFSSLFNHFLRHLLELSGGFLVHRYELSELSRKHLESVIHRNRLLHVSFHSFLHGLEHGSGSGISRLFPILYIVLYVPQNGKEQVFYLLYLRFILAQLLSVQKLQVLPCFRPVFRLIFIKSEGEAVAISINWFRAIIPFAAVS